MADPVNTILRLVMHFRWSGTVVVNNTLTFATSETGVLASPLAVDFRDNIWPGWRARLDSPMVLETISVGSMIPDTSDNAVLTINQAGTDAIPGGASTFCARCPVVLAAVITWRSATPGRSGRGRMYLAGEYLRSNDGLRWHATEAAKFEATASAIRTRYQLGGNPHAWRLIVFSRKIGGREPPYSALGAQDVVSHTVQPYYATMGSRRLGHGI